MRTDVARARSRSELRGRVRGGGARSAAAAAIQVRPSAINAGPESPPNTAPGEDCEALERVGPEVGPDRTHVGADEILARSRLQPHQREGQDCRGEPGEETAPLPRPKERERDRHPAEDDRWRGLVREQERRRACAHDRTTAPRVGCRASRSSLREGIEQKGRSPSCWRRAPSGTSTRRSAGPSEARASPTFRAAREGVRKAVG